MKRMAVVQRWLRVGCSYIKKDESYLLPNKGVVLYVIVRSPHKQSEFRNSVYINKIKAYHDFEHSMLQGQHGSQPQSHPQPHSHSGSSMSAERHTTHSNSHRSASRSSPSNKAGVKRQSSGRISFIGDQVETGF